MADTNIYDMADTWNDGGTTFSAIKMNVTDSASNAASLLMDLQVGGSSVANFRKDGQLSLFPNATAAERVTISKDGTFSSLSCSLFTANTGGGAFGWSAHGRQLHGGGLKLLSTDLLSWQSDAVFGSNDTILLRDAANTLALRNSTNAQAFNIYNTFTSGSVYERGFMRWASNVLEIGTEHVGGTARSVILKPSGGTVTIQGPANSRLQLAGTGNTQSLYVAYGDNLEFQHNGTTTARLSSGAFIAAGFNCRSASIYDAPDVGFARSTTGVAKITNGSTGTGKLIFIVPTSDPGITGALWNNAGTLSISA